MRRGKLILCNGCKKLIGGFSSRALKDTSKRLLKSLSTGFCDKCEKNRNKINSIKSK